MMNQFIIISIGLMIANASLSLSVSDESSNEEYIEELNENNIDSIEQIESTIGEDDLLDFSQFGLKLFGKPDNETTKERLNIFDPVTENVNPEELGTYLEGDILIPPSSSRNGMLSRMYRWPRGIVPYDIRGSFTSKELYRIEKGIREYHSKTCIRFKPRTNEKNYISIVNGPSGCWSSIGRIGGRQEVNLQTPACLARGSGTFMHEVMHALGFLHEQNRYERDNYIAIQYQNINKNALHNFDKASPREVYAFGVPYDYGSIMHYSAYSFSATGQPTIIPKRKTGIMGQRNGFSISDVKKINAMYKCRHKKILQN